MRYVYNIINEIVMCHHFSYREGYYKFKLYMYNIKIVYNYLKLLLNTPIYLVVTVLVTPTSITLLTDGIKLKIVHYKTIT